MVDKRAKDNRVNSIYLLTNTFNGKIYIGQTWNKVENRLGDNGVGYSHCTHLYSAILKHGCDKFRYTDVMAICGDQETADYLEDYYIEEYRSRDPKIGYNIKGGGSAGKHSEETKKKISETLKAQAAAWSPEILAQRTEAISTYWLGKERGPHTEEWKEGNSKMMIERHKNTPHPMLGKNHSEEALAKMSEASKEAWRSGSYSEESIKKRAAARMMPKEKEQGIIKTYQEGKTIDDICGTFETKSSGVYRVLNRNNIPLDNGRNHWDGKTHSEETRQKMSEKRKQYWEEWRRIHKK
jgi:group I intron endonuclease